eukprot:scaffold68069_cov71-Phaeocystis_antarctica.AAC.2
MPLAMQKSFKRLRSSVRRCGLVFELTASRRRTRALIKFTACASASTFARVHTHRSASHVRLCLASFTLALAAVVRMIAKSSSGRAVAAMYVARRS